MRIFRHDKVITIGTDLDPIEDILNFITALKSKGFTSDLLKEVHGFVSATEIKRTTELISSHIDNALGLAKQGFDGPAETSFLPLYYSSLNLIKVYLLFLGQRVALENNRWHGAKYFEDGMTKQFLNEKIKILKNGAIPLIYTTISGKAIPKGGVEIKLEEIYSCISSIGAEYSTITKSSGGLLCLNANYIEDAGSGHYLKIDILDNASRANPPQPRKIKAFSGLQLVRPTGGVPYYTSRKIMGNPSAIQRKLLSSVKRYLLSDQQQGGGAFSNWIAVTPINGRQHVFNEELCILLAYFHLSNVVRYNPEHLYKLMDSKYWAIILGLRKHGFLRFLKLMWGNYNKASFDIG